MRFAYEAAVPAVVFGATSYPLSHGSLGVVRSLGRAGITVSAVIEDRFVPHGYSRFLKSEIVRPLKSGLAREMTLESLVGIGRALGRHAVLLPTDDEGAVLAAENQAILGAHFLMPPVAPGLPGELASKRRLNELCLRYDVPTPRTHFAKKTSEALIFAETARFPIIVKNSEPWKRIEAPAVTATTRIDSRHDFFALAATWPTDPHIIVQEYIPSEVAEDWIVHAYRSRDGHNDVIFTGRKYRSWPPSAGVTVLARAQPNQALLATASRFLSAINYRGIVDMDWRLDTRDGLYKLVDCNPRIGANFRLFVNEAGIDVVRAAHLDLTGRIVPTLGQVYDRRLIVENLYAASFLIGGRGGSKPKGKIELAWFAWDDPRPFFVMALRFTGSAIARLSRALWKRRTGTWSISTHPKRPPGFKA
jgi:predicted ATP-grasp superfamily ATP-dependent carboligase